MYSFYDVYHYTCHVLGRITIFRLLKFCILNLTLILTLTLILIPSLIQTLILSIKIETHGARNTKYSLCSF